ncbi:MAG: GDP-mannose 4,6-dehydratase [Euryarchaeota archaeon]|nr:GDP-mannose 4,6-dehydratase [Euryarchaeota archaeon]
MKYLVTGSSGQLGSYLVEELARKGDKVLGLDLRSSGIKDVDRHTILGDIRDPAMAHKLMSDVDVVVHAAAQVSVTESVKDPIFDANTNVIGTLNLLKAAAEKDVGRFVYISSAAVFGNPRYLPIDEGHPSSPISPYGASKLAAERYAFAFQHTYELPVVVIRPFNIYSPRQDPDNPYSGVISMFLSRLKEGKPPIIYGDGSQTRDFISAMDVVQMIILAATSRYSVGHVFNGGTGKPVSINELADKLAALAGKKVTPIYEPARPSDIMQSYADISKAREVMGYEPAVDLDRGLKELIRG